MKNKELESAIDDLKFMKAKSADPFSEIVWGMAITICELHLEKPNSDPNVQECDANGMIKEQKLETK